MSDQRSNQNHPQPTVFRDGNGRQLTPSQLREQFASNQPTHPPVNPAASQINYLGNFSAQPDPAPTSANLSNVSNSNQPYQVQASPQQNSQPAFWSGSVIDAGRAPAEQLPYGTIENSSCSQQSYQHYPNELCDSLSCEPRCPRCLDKKLLKFWNGFGVQNGPLSFYSEKIVYFELIKSTCTISLILKTVPIRSYLNYLTENDQDHHMTSFSTQISPEEQDELNRKVYDFDDACERKLVYQRPTWFYRHPNYWAEIIGFEQIRNDDEQIRIHLTLRPSTPSQLIPVDFLTAAMNTENKNQPEISDEGFHSNTRPDWWDQIGEMGPSSKRPRTSSSDENRTQVLNSSLGVYDYDLPHPKSITKVGGLRDRPLVTQQLVPSQRETNHTMDVGEPSSSHTGASQPPVVDKDRPNPLVRDGEELLLEWEVEVFISKDFVALLLDLCECPEKVEDLDEAKIKELLKPIWPPPPKDLYEYRQGNRMLKYNERSPFLDINNNDAASLKIGAKRNAKWVKLLRVCLKKNGNAREERRAFWYELVYKVNNLRDGHRKKKEDDEKEKKIAVLLMKAGGLLKEIGTAIQANGSIDQYDWDNLLEQFDAIQPADPQPVSERFYRDDN
ncbi:unnamed protein product, partial [Mesorhabditis belari]|uniref:Uncharacterized protein n=1 Tax=Mesorhabditis belari TaxID=2138241 RepID=A0AAF3EX10_9BILA